MKYEIQHYTKLPLPKRMIRLLSTQTIINNLINLALKCIKRDKKGVSDGWIIMESYFF